MTPLAPILGTSWDTFPHRRHSNQRHGRCHHRHNHHNHICAADGVALVLGIAIDFASARGGSEIALALVVPVDVDSASAIGVFSEPPFIPSLN